MTDPVFVQNSDLDYDLLDKEMDRVKTKVFLGKNAAFLGSLMCSLNFSWTSDIKTACTNGHNLWWNPYWFLQLPQETRLTVLLHELWHVAFMHMVRRGDRDPKLWNYACDIAINNMLKKQGFRFTGTSPWLDESYGEQPAEEIYDHLKLIQDFSPQQPLWGHEDIDGEADEKDILAPTASPADDPEEEDGPVHEGAIWPIINQVVQATQAALVAGEQAGDDAGNIQTILKRFLQPKLPWETLLFNFFNDMSDQDYSWSRPNRRYNDVYLPSLVETDNGLEHLIYYLDVSGSVSDGEVLRFNSEVKYIKETFKPQKLTLVLFDTIIQREYVFLEEDPFEEVVIVGRGGTSLVPVRDHMIQHQPTAAVIFSDLFCSQMEPLPKGMDVKTIWVAVNNRGAEVKFGKLVHIRE